jgi:WD40 repeat protein
MLRRVRGAHQEDICISAFDFHLRLIATGCTNGEIALYDFELSKVEGLLIAHTADITGLEFMSPYPILLSSSIDCTVCIWGVRPIAEKLQNICLKRFINLSW